MSKKIYDDITKTIGNTPLVKINRLTEGLPGTILVKLESFNPLSSVKDRIGVVIHSKFLCRGCGCRRCFQVAYRQ